MKTGVLSTHTKRNDSVLRVYSRQANFKEPLLKMQTLPNAK